MSGDEEGVDEAVVALDDEECAATADANDSLLYSVPPQVSKYFIDFGRAVRRMQFDAAAQVMHAAIDSARATDGAGYGRNASEVASWKEIMAAFGQLAAAEGAYIALPFLQHIRHQLTTKREAEMRRAYAATVDSFTRIAAHLLPGTVPHHICRQCLAFADARETLIDCHRRIVAVNEANAGEPLDTIEGSLQKAAERVKEFHHPLLSDLAQNFSLEAEMLRSLLVVQRSVLYTGILETTLRLKEAKERLQFWMKDVDWGSNERRGIFSSALKPSEKWARCRLVAYLHSYHAWLTLKYSFLFHETLGPYVNPLDAPKEGEESMDGLTLHEVLAPIKKREKEAMMVILIDRSRDSDACYIAGRDYKCPPLVPPLPPSTDDADAPPPSASTAAAAAAAPSSSTSGRCFPLLYLHAPDKQLFAAHYDEMAARIRGSQAALDEGRRVHVTRRRDGAKDRHTTFFYERLESRLVLVVVIPGKRAERDIHITKFFAHFGATFRGATLAARWRLL